MPVTIHPVILSGGAGTRLWPLSREAAPKPFMQLPDGETLLAKTAARALALPGAAALLTVTNRDYYFHTKDTYSGVQLPSGPPAIYLLEPFGRNTAPAIALAALCAKARGRNRVCTADESAPARDYVAVKEGPLTSLGYRFGLQAGLS